MRIIALTFLALVAAPAGAEIVSRDGVNCRSSGDSSAEVVTRLGRGAAVDVLSSEGGWTRVSLRGGRECWVSDRFIVDADDGAVVPLAGSSSRAPTYLGSAPSATKATRKRSMTVRATRSRPMGFSSGSCSCSGGNVCVGPRGGRYCITSGGSKRYGL